MEKYSKICEFIQRAVDSGSLSLAKGIAIKKAAYKKYINNSEESKKYELINNNIKKMKEGNNGEVSDGDHTFNELYDHRVVLFASLCNLLTESGCTDAFKTRLHDDGSSYDGWFLAGIRDSINGDISYHCPDKYWDLFKCDEIEKAPPFDGYTSDDVLERLMQRFCKNSNKDI